MNKVDWFLIAITVGVVLAAGVKVSKTAALIHTRSQPPEPLSHLETWEKYLEPGARIGPDSAQVTILQFIDYRCGPSRGFGKTTDEVLRAYPDQVALVTRLLPAGSVESRTMAAAAVCAEQYGVFPSYHRLLLSKREASADSLVRWALLSGVSDTVAFARCLVSSRTSDWLDVDKMAADHLRIRATPTYFVNGDRYRGAQPHLMKRIERKLHEREAGSVRGE